MAPQTQAPKRNCVVALIAADTAARADQLFRGIARTAGVLTRGRPLLFRVPFRVVSARNTEHSEEGNGQPGCQSATPKAVYTARWGDFTRRNLSSNKLYETSTTVRMDILFPAYFKWRQAVELNHPRLLLRGPLVLAPFLELLNSCNYSESVSSPMNLESEVFKEKTKCSGLDSSGYRCACRSAIPRHRTRSGGAHTRPSFVVQGSFPQC
ncbi:hypothetical protein NDU88_004966 [Pleurodeles waltl]|uniref:Uncharacterized protein n=1 Tax=Pleurodeles waltl TaxID=8319 RepID=A0AAV7TVW7_PLEWA|nr:hypothetical protein NDU88_004966 [Pleurodeles waltl]